MGSFPSLAISSKPIDAFHVVTPLEPTDMHGQTSSAWQQPSAAAPPPAMMLAPGGVEADAASAVLHDALCDCLMHEPNLWTDVRPALLSNGVEVLRKTLRSVNQGSRAGLNRLLIAASQHALATHLWRRRLRDLRSQAIVCSIGALMVVAGLGWAALMHLRHGVPAFGAIGLVGGLVLCAIKGLPNPDSKAEGGAQLLQSRQRFLQHEPMALAELHRAIRQELHRNNT